MSVVWRHPMNDTFTAVPTERSYEPIETGSPAAPIVE